MREASFRVPKDFGIKALGFEKGRAVVSSCLEIEEQRF